MALTSLRLPGSWRAGAESFRSGLSRDLRLIAIASSVSMAKSLRYAAAVGARGVLLGVDQPDVWRPVLQRARTGPFTWAVALSFEFLEEHVYKARWRFGHVAANYDDATILRALILLGHNQLHIQAEHGGGVGPM
jgi:hypothetical protein